MAALALPFSVTEYTNPRTKRVSYRVTGYHAIIPGGRLRKNFKTLGSAEAFRDLKNSEAIRRDIGAEPLRVATTRLTEAELQLAEAAKARARWPIAQIIEAGELALKRLPTNVLVEPLMDAWLDEHEATIGERWFNTIRKAVRRFQRDTSTLRTQEFTKAFFLEWLASLKKPDGSKVGGQTKANYRNALRRVCTDLCDAGKLADNPCVGLRISRGAKKAPSTLSYLQAEALIRAFESDENCRRILGWAVECLFVGLRPENEAQRAEWSEINLRNAEQHVAGKKRGVKPRIAPLLPAAVAWLRVVKKDLEMATPKGGTMPRPGEYSRHWRERAVKLANESLAKHHPREPLIVWDEDILRHTYASMRAPLVAIGDLAEDMGNSATTIYSHYRHPKPKREAENFWAIRPKRRSPG